MSKIKKYKGRFPEELGGLPTDIKASLMREAITFGIKEKQETIIRCETELKYKFDTAFTGIGSVRTYNKESLEVTIAEAYQAIAFYKEVYKNAETLYFKIKEERFSKGVDEFLKTKQKPKVVNPKETN